MKKRFLVTTLVLCLAVSLAACGNKEKEAGTDTPVTAEIIPITEPLSSEEVSEEVVEEDSENPPEGMVWSELTGLPIDESLANQKPIAAMVDNESTALPHFGLNTADIIYEMVNSTANDRITRLMVIYKDWGNIEQLGSIRSVRPTHIWVASEYNAVICHDGGPFYIDVYMARDYAQHFSGIFSRVNNGKAREFTEYIVKGDLEKAFEKSSYSTEYDEFYEGPHFKFARESKPIELEGDAATDINMSAAFKHNKSELKYDESTGLYTYYVYGKVHADGKTGEALTFKNVILQSAGLYQLDKNGYCAYTIFGDTGKGDGYYITNGKAVKITWEKSTENGITHYFLENGDELTLNAGKTYIALIPDEYWSETTLN
jgi:predicted small secreted protein